MGERPRRRTRRSSVDLAECDRSLEGHQWDRVPDPGGWKPERKFFARRVSRCRRCHTYRYRGLNAYGQVERTWYDYPPEWKDRWGVGATRPSSDDVRLKHLLNA